MIIRRHVLVIEDRKVHSVLIKMALRRLDEWLEVRWVRDVVEAREALEAEPGTDLILYSTGEDGPQIRRGVRTLLGSSKERPIVAVVCDLLSQDLRTALEDQPVTTLEHPLKAGDLGALLHAAAVAHLPLIRGEVRR